MSVILGIFPASIGKKTYFFALGTIPETGVGFIGKKITGASEKYSNLIAEINGSLPRNFLSSGEPTTGLVFTIDPSSFSRDID